MLFRYGLRRKCAKACLDVTHKLVTVCTGPARYDPFNTLSGGQQAMAALALSLAVAKVFPCSIAIYDEIDANVCSFALVRAG